MNIASFDRPKTETTPDKNAKLNQLHARLALVEDDMKKIPESSHLYSLRKDEKNALEKQIAQMQENTGSMTGDVWSDQPLPTSGDEKKSTTLEESRYGEDDLSNVSTDDIDSTLAELSDLYSKN